MSVDVVVLGAGPAGVAAAYRAARDGRSVVVIERAPAPGGAAGSFEIAGIRVDFGSHRLHPSVDPAILSELRALLGDDLQPRRRNGRIRLDGRWLAFPLRPGDLVRRLPPALALAAARDAALAPLRRPRADTFAEVVRAGLGPTLGDRFYFPYARKLWGLEPEQISGEQARRRIGAGSARKLLRRVVGRERGERGVFLYPRRGYGQISEALAAAAAAAGAELKLGTAATTVELGDDGVRIEVEKGSSVEAAAALSTLPVTVLARLARPAPDEEALTAAARLRFRAMVLVYLVLPVDRYTPFDAHYLPEEWTPVTRISEPTNYRDGDDPAGRTVLCAEIPCEREDEIWTAPDEELAAIVLAALAGAELPPAEPLEVAVRRLPFVYPVYERGYEHALERLEAWADAQPRLLSFGRGGLFAHDNAHHALAEGWAAAAALDGEGVVDRHAWAAAKRRFAAHVVED